METGSPDAGPQARNPGGGSRVPLRSTRATVLATALGLLLSGGCASRGDTLVVVVPGQSGEVGGVVVNPGPDEQVLETAYAAVWARGGSVKRTEVSTREVEDVFSEAKAALPMAPVSYLLYFREGSDSFASRSLPVVDQIFAEIAKRPAVEITVIGHTDGVGYRADNDLLSRQRAGRVRRDLIELGISADIIKAAGRGEREPLVPAADEVDEPRNRRVEINVR